MKYIFLDIDGVLNGHAAFENHYCGIKPECVDAFNKLLDHFFNAKIVIASAWRYMIIKGTMTLKGFEYLLLSHGINCSGKVLSHTREDTDAVEPRIDQILDWLKENDPECDDWLSLDDLYLHHKNCYQTDGMVGFTLGDLDMIKIKNYRKA
jgi:hypothetical protein